MRSEMLLAKARNELILKELVEKQAAYLLVCFRQKLLSVPHAYSRRLLGISDAHEMGLKLREMALALLEELQDLPQKIADPNWLAHIWRQSRAGRKAREGQNAPPKAKIGKFVGQRSKTSRQDARRGANAHFSNQEDRDARPVRWNGWLSRLS